MSLLSLQKSESATLAVLQTRYSTNQWTYKQYFIRIFNPAPTALCCPQNDVYTAVCADDIAELSNLQRECSILKRLLHLTLRKWSEVALLRMRRAIRVETCQLFELFARIPELSLISPENFRSLFFSARNI